MIVADIEVAFIRSYLTDDLFEIPLPSTRVGMGRRAPTDATLMFTFMAVVIYSLVQVEL